MQYFNLNNFVIVFFGHKATVTKTRSLSKFQAEQKRKIAARVTAVLIEDGKAKRENIHVSFHDVPATNYAEAGMLVADQKRTP